MGLYVYAVTGSAVPPFDVAGRRVEFVAVGGVHAAITRTDTRPPLTEEALREQHDVVDAVSDRVDALLPARFGSLVDQAELERVVRLRADAIADALALVSGRQQMTVRVFGEPESPPQSQASTGTAYLQQRADAERFVPELVRPIADALRPFVKAERIVRGERGVAATLYHLIPRGCAVQYQAALEPVRVRFPAPGFIVSGPWPPFAFAPELWA